MKRPFRRILILLAVFVAGLIGFSKLTNHETRYTTKDMEEARLPVLYLLEDGERVNELHGYVDEMNAPSMRDTIMPLEADGNLSILAETYGQEVRAVSYEVRSLDTTRLVQEDTADEIVPAEEGAQIHLKIPNLLTAGEEYILILRVDTETDSCRFYTRIIQEENSYIEECLDFVKDFHAITMDRERMEELAAYMEPAAGEDNATLQTVTIHNSLSQACWGTLEGEPLTEPVASIKELNDTYNVIVLNYLYRSEEEDGESSVYNVEEYYRVRYGTEKMYLLSFERSVEEIFRGDEDKLSGGMLRLGIRSADVDFRANETGTVICFVQQGELWSYNRASGILSKVFSFRGEDSTDPRENYNEHDIRIIRADEGGGVDFIVFGYMNRGDQEGRVGINVCHYDSMTNTVERELFIPSTDSYQMMKEEIGQAMYISDDGHFYLVMGGQAHCVDLETMQDEIFIEEITPDTYACSEDGRYLAWTKGDAADAEVMYLTDFETRTTSEIPAGPENRIRPVTFLQNDCVCGIAPAGYVSAQSGLFPMNRLDIVDCEAGGCPVVKSYDSGSTFIMGTVTEGGSILLQRAVYSDGVYIETTPDTIVNRDMQEEQLVAVSEIQSDAKEREVVLTLPGEAGGSLNILVPKIIASDNPVELELSGSLSVSEYYVYAKGRILLGSNQIAAAVSCANENRGVVIGRSQDYVWKRARKTSAGIGIADMGGETSQAKALQVLLKQAGIQADTDAMLAEGKTAWEVLTEAADGYPVFNLTGCSCEETLYFVGTGKPVYALLNGAPTVICGYDEANLTVWRPDTGQTEELRLTEAEKVFADSGNVYFVIGG